MQTSSRSFRRSSAQRARAGSQPSSSVVVLPLALLIGCARDLEQQCRSAARRARVLLHVVPPTSDLNEVATMQPLVIVMPRDHYALAPWTFELLAEKGRASLLLLNGDKTMLAELPFQLRESVDFMKTLRQSLRT